MEQYGGGGSWTMIPNVQTHSNSPAQDQFYTTSQQQPQQQQFNQQFLPQHQQRLIQQQQQQHHPSLASQFHLLPLVQNLADAIDNGTRDQHSDALVNELNTNFDKCQNLLNSLFGSNTSKSMTVEGQRRKVEETEQLLNQRRELIGKYRSSVEELIKPEM